MPRLSDCLVSSGVHRSRPAHRFCSRQASAKGLRVPAREVQPGGSTNLAEEVALSR